MEEGGVVEGGKDQEEEEVGRRMGEGGRKGGMKVVRAARGHSVVATLSKRCGRPS